jgi:hypothetical protein
LYGTWLKSFNETQPDFGVASAPVDVQLYVEGRAQDCAVTVVVHASNVIPADARVALIFMNLIVTDCLLLARVSGKKVAEHVEQDC